MPAPTNILADLARAKALFQIRTIALVIGAHPNSIENLFDQHPDPNPLAHRDPSEGVRSCGGIVVPPAASAASVLAPFHAPEIARG